MSSHPNCNNRFAVNPWVHHLGNFVERHQGLWRRLGGWETRLLSDSIPRTTIERPVYIAGLARSGTTKLLEVMNWHTDVVTHRYRDFPFLYTPYFWNRFLDFVPDRESELTERAHKDGIYVNPDSPEAFEEVLWMAFFRNLHDPEKSAVLNESTQNSEFENFYADHIRKLLIIRSGNQYVSKSNYNITRFEYLLKIFPSARFIVPVRDPVWHIASLMKQHKLFCEAQQNNPRAMDHLRRAGHFEFGLDRRPINTGDSEEILRIQDLWKRNRIVEAWARYWNHTHSYIANRLEQNSALASATKIVRYEELCRDPATNVHSVLTHCGLSSPPELLKRARYGIHFPEYYRPRFSEQELATIRRLTEATSARFRIGKYSRFSCAKKEPTRMTWPDTPGLTGEDGRAP